ncbi:MarR family winged helix-turn-helix transcriptional regulator [Paracandidimonas soli]|uniref:MarR family winged helix-turn-helix transcriptional regulator n=1 Tax=Paracandidimonas soli TaxID=1917182 RepID=UPI001049C9C7|nr:MarR family winged helix-turn-helix transcriptional regulator [Paracandidimonas soli]
MADIDPRSLLAYRILSLSSLLNRGIESILQTEVGLSVRQWRVLLYLGSRGPDSVQRIADFWRYDKSQVSRAVTELQALSAVQVNPDKHDRRSVVVSLTRTGRRLYARALPLSLHRQARLTNCVSDKEIAIFDRTLDALTHQAEMLLEEAQGKSDSV